MLIQLICIFYLRKKNVNRDGPPSIHKHIPCCEEAQRILLEHSVLVKNIWCFKVYPRSGQRPRLSYYNLTEYDRAYSHYLSMAKVFIIDVGTQMKQRNTIIWKIEDDATLPASFLRGAESSKFAVFGHAVSKASNVSHLYTSLVPNFHFIESRGFEKVARQNELKGTKFTSRERSVFWAGSSTGTCNASLNCTDCFHLERVKLVESSKNYDWLKVRISRAIQWCRGREKELASRNMLAAHVAEQEWTNSRGVLDIDGNVDAWGQKWRLESGSVVFLVDSMFTNMYSDFIRDGEHYIRISSDLSNLASTTSLILREDADAMLENITINAKTLMRNFFSYGSVVTRVSEVLSRSSAFS